MRIPSHSAWRCCRSRQARLTTDDAVVEPMASPAAGHRRDRHARPSDRPSSTPASITRIDDDDHRGDGLQTSGRRAQPHRRRLRPARQRRRKPGRHPLAGARRRRCLRLLSGRRRQPADPPGRASAISTRCSRLNYEQARQIEVLRGPGSAMFGASAVHGVINVDHALRARTYPTTPLGVEGGSDSFTRVRFSGSRMVSARIPTRASACTESRRALRAGATIRESTKQSSICWPTSVSAAGSCDCVPRAPCSTRRPRASSRATTATGRGPGAEPIRIPKRFATPRARACRHITKRATSSARTRLLNVAGIYRRSRMDFLQHFLIGKPLEHNAQTSYMVSGTAAFSADKLTTRVALDAETASSELTEFQPDPATDGAPPANAIRPAGLHYDYTRGFLDARRHARARVPLRQRLSRRPPRCAPIRLTTTTTTT